MGRSVTEIIITKATNSLEREALSGKNKFECRRSEQGTRSMAALGKQRQNYGEYLYSDRATPVARSEAISDRLRKPRTNN